jgi:hypothetical protein
MFIKSTHTKIFTAAHLYNRNNPKGPGWRNGSMCRPCIQIPVPQQKKVTTNYYRQ